MTQERTSQTLGALLSERRREEGLSVRAMAAKLGISASLLSDLEGEKRFPSEPILKKLAKHLRVEVVDLRKLDRRVRVADLRHLVAVCPQLGSAIQQMIKEIREGQSTPQEFADLLWHVVRRRGKQVCAPAPDSR